MTKKAVVILTLAFISATSVFSQTQNDLLGDWTVIKVVLPDNLTPEMKAKMTGMVDNFKKAIFHFKANNEFILQIPDKNIQIKSAKWNYDQTHKIVSIRGKDPMGNIGLLMNLGIKIEQSTYYFLLDETPFVLQVNKKN